MKTITAHFFLVFCLLILGIVPANATSASLKITRVGTGNITIISSPVGINCGSSCKANFAKKSHVTLTATPALGSVFIRWKGACKGTIPSCTLTLKEAKNVTVISKLTPITLNVSKTGSGLGTVTSSPAGIDCGAICTASYAWKNTTKPSNSEKSHEQEEEKDDHLGKTATVVTLTANPATGSVFTGWTGACTGTMATCTITMDQARAVSAGFAPSFKTLNLTKNGSGAGTITSSPAGIDCGISCSASFATDTQVTLTAIPATSSTFGGWLGACTGTASSCTVTLHQAQTVNASFLAPAVTSYQYDPNGNLTQITDPLGRVRQYQFDSLNQPISQLEPHPTIIGSTLGQIDIDYDNLGQITRITDPRNLTTRYILDSLGNVSQQISPDTGITLTDHDAAGNIKTRTDARGKTANYRYDSLNRINQVVYDDQTINYSWDNCDHGINRLCSLSNNNSSIRYAYDSHGRITGKTQSAGAISLTVSHSYNAAGQRTSSLSPGGQSTEYQWTSNHITAITSNGQPVISQITYEPNGHVNGWFWGNNQPNERFYDLSGHAAIISLGFDAKTQMPNSRYYSYDAAGRLTSTINDSDPKLNQHHDYDQLDRLIASQRGEPKQSLVSYNYDLNGNRTEKIVNDTTLHSYSIDLGSNHLQSQSGAQTASYSYDPAGNLTSDGVNSHSYNAAGRRIATTTAGQTVGYGYDPLGQRITKTVAGNMTQYFYDEQGHLTGEYDASGQLIQEIIWLGDLPVAVLKPVNNLAVSPEIYYIHADHLGTPRKITRPIDNRVVWSWESEAFGNSLPDQNPAGLGTFVFNLRFPGQYYDQETGLFYNYFRDYDPATGRYIESDPIGLAGGVNTYTYVENNPVNWIDSSGLIVEIDGTTQRATNDLNRTYHQVRNTNIGKQMCEILENSPEKYLITNKTDNFIQNGDRASYSDGFKTIVVDPSYHPVINTKSGPQVAPTIIVLGHEIGHAATGLDDGPSPDRMENVNATENLIRDELGLPRRTTYP